MDYIIIRGAREHNLKNLDVDIPRDKFIVITGLSGSGKSSLAFDTIYAEGQRRFIESLSAYARQFLGNMEKPDVDFIDGLSPSISIEQKSTSANPRSTVGTITEIYDFLRLLYARVGKPHCPNCGNLVERMSNEQIYDSIFHDFFGKKVDILAPVVRGRKGHYRELFEDILRDGFLKARVDGEIRDIEKGMKLERYKVHNIEIVIDRVEILRKSERRIKESLEYALNYGNGIVLIFDGEREKIYNRTLACLNCGVSLQELAPNSFSFNSPYGYCPDCEGLGVKKQLDPSLVIPDWSKSINEEAIAPYGKPKDNWFFNQLRALAEAYNFDFDTPLNDLPKKVKDILLYGSGSEKLEFRYKLGSGEFVTYQHRFNGILNQLQHTYETTTSNNIREWIEAYMSVSICPTCNGYRLKKESLSVKINEKNIGELTHLSIKDLKKFFDEIKFSGREEEIARQILKEIRMRLEFLINVGLEYLTLDRNATTLSGGEAQRIRLATQIGSQLVGVLYVLDEPSIGLHQRDNIKLINSLKQLRDLGNTIIVVEHDKETILNADYLIDLGPGAAQHGGQIVVQGELKELLSNGEKEINNSITLQYLLNKKFIPFNFNPRPGNGKYIILKGARGNNLKNITVKFPLGKFICITGVSGSGKSTLINDTLGRILFKKFYNSKLVPLPYDSISGLNEIDKVIEIDQSPIGRSPRSNPATYTTLFTLIRDLFAELPDSKIRGYKAGRFSFNVKGGRCEECEGDGLKKIEMNFLPDVYVLCDVCKGKRYNKETLEVKYKGKTIADVLDMTVEEALSFFEDLPRIKRKLKTLYDVGLGYIRLGQQATTLSGGEAQRVKLATELSKVQTGRTLYILDEPTTGLHFEDIRVLLDVLNNLVNKGNTVIVIEHNLDVIKSADWIIDLGPEGGDAGGYIVAEGTPLDLTKFENSYTGKFLKAELEQKN
ncbi:MAG: excinuclease ABC subunit UvrA [Ignavibacteria bacterium]|nr:excinuclease ABC subunit UvrA [Ignavibacteria bacterium]